MLNIIYTVCSCSTNFSADYINYNTPRWGHKSDLSRTAYPFPISHALLIPSKTHPDPLAGPPAEHTCVVLSAPDNAHGPEADGLIRVANPHKHHHPLLLEPELQPRHAPAMNKQVGRLFACKG